jgi:L-amino acid N-acyltransferase YncA
MASCYGAAGARPFTTPAIPWLPEPVALRDGRAGHIRALTPGDTPRALELLNHAVLVDRAWPFEAALGAAEFEAYFCSHAAFGLLVGGTIVGAFYCKPNFPGRCDGICNGGFVVAPEARRRGVGRAMADCFFRVGERLGYRGALFNLVFASNTASVALWRSVGMQLVGTIPGAARMRRDGAAAAAAAAARGAEACGAGSAHERGAADAFEYVDAHIMFRSLVAAPPEA